MCSPDEGKENNQPPANASENWNVLDDAKMGDLHKENNQPPANASGNRDVLDGAMMGDLHSTPSEQEQFNLQKKESLSDQINSLKENINRQEGGDWAEESDIKSLYEESQKLKKVKQNLANGTSDLAEGLDTQMLLHKMPIGETFHLVGKNITEQNVDEPVTVFLGHSMLIDLANSVRELGSGYESDAYRMFCDILSLNITSNHGVVVTHTGDGISAVWGESKEKENKLYKTTGGDPMVSAAFGIIQMLRKYNLNNCHVRIGMDFGGIGHNRESRYRQSLYSENITHPSYFGVPLTASSRIQVLAKKLNFDIIMTDRVFGTLSSKTRDLYDFIYIGKHLLRDFSKPTALYAAFEKNNINNQTQQAWGEAMKEFEDRNWQQAADIFKKIDHPALETMTNILMRNCDRNMKNPDIVFPLDEVIVK